jgi:hypothetical protein
MIEYIIAGLISLTILLILVYIILGALILDYRKIENKNEFEHYDIKIIRIDTNCPVYNSDFVYWQNPEKLRYILTNDEMLSIINITPYFNPAHHEFYFEIKYINDIDIDELTNKILSL